MRKFTIWPNGCDIAEGKGWAMQSYGKRRHSMQEPLPNACPLAFPWEPVGLSLIREGRILALQGPQTPWDESYGAVCNTLPIAYRDTYKAADQQSRRPAQQKLALSLKQHALIHVSALASQSQEIVSTHPPSVHLCQVLICDGGMLKKCLRINWISTSNPAGSDSSGETRSWRYCLLRALGKQGPLGSQRSVLLLQMGELS